MIISNSGTKIEQQDYKDEAELQEILFFHPELLSDESSELISVKRELRTETGRVDVVMVDASGRITLVEVKLDRNSESHRTVLAQIFDYISELSKYTYFQLNQATDGVLGEAVDTFENNEALPTIIEDNLKNGLVRLVIAVDETNPVLQRLVEFVSNRTTLRVDLVEIKKFLNNNEIYYSSNPIVQSSVAIKNDTPKKHPTLDKIAEIWAKDSEGFPRLINSTASYRQIRVENWPSAVHYEFIVYRNKSLRVRLDNELSAKDSRQDRISTVMKPFVGKEIMGHTIEARPYSYANESGKILYITLDEGEADQAVPIMKELIKLTKNSVDEALKG